MQREIERIGKSIRYQPGISVFVDLERGWALFDYVVFFMLIAKKTLDVVLC